jgi:hypothetical protein
MPATNTARLTETALHVLEEKAAATAAVAARQIPPSMPIKRIDRNYELTFIAYRNTFVTSMEEYLFHYLIL